MNIKSQFKDWLRGQGLAEATVNNYAEIYSNDKLQTVIANMSNYSNLYECTDPSFIEKLINTIMYQDFNVVGHNRYTAGLKKYLEFIKANVSKGGNPGNVKTQPTKPEVLVSKESIIKARQAIDMLKSIGMQISDEQRAELTNMELQYMEQVVIPELEKVTDRLLSGLGCSYDIYGNNTNGIIKFAVID